MVRLLTILLLFALQATVYGETEEFKGGWPRMFVDQGNTVVVHQPQLEGWDRYEVIRGRSAISVKLKGDAREYLGAAYFDADTETAIEARQVLLKNFRVKRLEFPNLDEATAARCSRAFHSAIPKGKQLLASLDRIIAALPVEPQKMESVEVSLAPPPIYRSETPAILVLFMGEPRLELVRGAENLLFAVNTNWDILTETGSGEYYLLEGDRWLVSRDLVKGPWLPAQKVPKAFGKLPDDQDWKEVKKHLKAKPARSAPKVFVSLKPAELIVTRGTPTLSPVSGTKLFYVTNTESDLFLHHGSGHYYFLTSGRWFNARTLDGPWQAASAKLPADFLLIGTDHPKAHVLAAVPGTPEAKAALVMASIPQKATVTRTTKVTVVYEGTPQFVTVDGTKTVYYALNTPYSVFRVEGSYYCVHNGVWFIAPTPTGPWAVCTTVPAAIYTIPPSHPKHNVTYVYVYDSTPDTVVVGYTSGYSGSYVATTGVVMFGLGLWAGYELADDHHHYHHYHYHAHYYSYGCAARYDYYYGSYYRSASYYGPYGGAGGWAGYDPGSGTYYRGGYAQGPYGSAFAREAYNPYTDRYAAQAGAKTPYGSWGRTVAADGDDWVRAGHRTRGPQTVGGIQTSKGGVAIGGYNKLTDQGAVVGKNRYGDTYVGREGSIYKRSDDGWQKNTGDGWEQIDPPKVPDDTREKVSTAREERTREEMRQQDRATDRTARASQEQRGQLERSAERSRRTSQAQSRTPTVRSDRSTRSRSSGSINQLNRDYRSRMSGDRRANTYRQRGGGNIRGGSSRGGGFRR